MNIDSFCHLNSHYLLATLSKESWRAISIVNTEQKPKIRQCSLTFSEGVDLFTAVKP